MPQINRRQALLGTAALATVPYVEQTFGAWYIDGGLRGLVDAVALRALRALARHADVVHAHGLRAGFIAVLALRAASPRPSASTPPIPRCGSTSRSRSS